MKPTGKKYGSMISSSTGVSSGLSEASKFKPESENQKAHKTNQRPLKESIGKAGR